MALHSDPDPEHTGNGLVYPQSVTPELRIKYLNLDI